MNQLAERFRARVVSGECLVGVVGLGYVGLPLGLAFTKQGFRVLGFDVDAKKVTALGRGECYIQHLDDGPLREAVGQGLLSATADFDRLGEPDALLLCVRR
jgi:UDP-N-acetyl-D-glucosamine dehydrogenase